MAQDEGTFEKGAEAEIAALGAKPGDAALDLWIDPAGAAIGLGELGGARGSVLLRAARELGAAGAGAAPEPAAATWVLVTKGSAEIRVGGAGAADGAETRRVTRVVVDCAALAEGDGAVARVSLSLDRKGSGAQAGLLVGEAWARTEQAAVGRIRAAAGRLARALSVPASSPASGAAQGAGDAGLAGSEESDGGAGGEEVRAPKVAARALSRFTLRGEGPRLVLRDFSSRGPREGAGLNLLIGLVFSGLAAGAWTMFARAAGAAGVASAGALAWLGGSALLTLAAIAFLGVARFAHRYVATSAPLVSIGGGKVTVAPWVDRKGAVMLEPDGRFGAAIELGEVKGVSVQDRKGRHAVELATDHGPIDAIATDDLELSRLLASALGRAMDDLRPAAAPNARQRARARAAETGKPAIAR